MSVLVNGDVVRVTHAVRKQPCDSAHSSQLTAAHCCHYTYMQAILNITIELHVLNRGGGMCMMHAYHAPVFLFDSWS